MLARRRASSPRSPRGGCADLAEPEVAAVGRGQLDRRRRGAAARVLVEAARPACTSSPRSSGVHPRQVELGSQRRHRRAGSRLRGGAARAAISGCANHIGSPARSRIWRAVRRAVGMPVLAKDFVARSGASWPLLRDAGADVVLLLAVLHRSGDERGSLTPRSDVGLEPLVEAHDARELDRALATDARLIGINNRDLGTLEVDRNAAGEAPRATCRTIGWSVAESGVREPSTLVRWRAAGFDAALIGEALDARAGSCAATGAPSSPRADARGSRGSPTASRRSRSAAWSTRTGSGGDRAGADDIGLNMVAGTPRALDARRAAALAGLVRATAPAGSRPRIVAVTADTDGGAAAGDRRGDRPGRGPAQLPTSRRCWGVAGTADLEGPPPSGDGAD